MNWYIEVLKKYAVFSGRARRKEYWYFFLFNAIISVVLAVIDRMTGSFSTKASLGLLGGLYSLAVLIPSIAVLVRRLHDTDRSSWWLLILLIPLIGAIVFLVFTVQDSKAGANQYGANPKETTAEKEEEIIHSRTVSSKCTDCGNEYTNFDYREDAKDWFCSQCKAKLPKI